MSFAKHETFHIREGWLFKGMVAIKKAENKGQLPTIFLDKDAPERLGIGRNMVRSLRFWMQATGLAEERIEKRQRTQRLTNFGKWVWEHDPYLENEATLWLIHYHLVCSLKQATTWYWFFNYFSPITFDIDTCTEALKTWIPNEYHGKAVAEQTLKKDVNCLVRTYLPSQNTDTPENSIDSPLSRLRLINKFDTGQGARYRLMQSNLSHLHPLIVLYVLLDQHNRLNTDIQTLQVGLHQALRAPMNVGRTFNLTTAGLTDLLDMLNKQYPHLQVKFTRTAGLDLLTLPNFEPSEILNLYVQEHILIQEAV